MNKRLASTICNSHYFTFNPDSNGGEAVTLATTYQWNGKPEGIYTTHEIILNSYGNTASINLGVSITPEMLRQLADELEEAKVEAEKAVQKLANFINA